MKSANDLSFIKLSENQISDNNLKKIYSKFTFSYLSLTSLNQPDEIENYLYDYFLTYKFITYQFVNTSESLIQNGNKIKSSDQNSNNIIICVEENCHIIEKIDFSIIERVIIKLKEKQIKVLNVSKNSDTFSNEEKESNEEINNFIMHFYYKISKNTFIKYTIRPIIGFLIRRYFYPTEYFKDPSFFIFENQTKEKEMRKKLLQSLNSRDSSQFHYNFSQLLQSLNEKNENEIREFQMNDFVILRTLFGNDKASFSLVIHLESLYIFMMKKVNCFNDEIIKEIEHESYFCKNFSHRCLTKFYGFVKNKEKIVFIYEFLCNGSLMDLIKNNPKKIDDIFILMAINRFFQGIEYFHLNLLVHRDLKPLNILIDHDFIPYISDFDEIRHFSQDKESNEKMTNDISCLFCTSPEQNRGEALTSSSDVYSFGKIIYYLYEKKENDSDNLKNIKSKIIQSLYKLCTKLKPEERIKHHEIKSLIIDEISLFNHLEKYLIDETNNFYSTNVIQFLIEYLIILPKEEIGRFCTNIINFKNLFTFKIENNYSSLYLTLGILYCNGNVVKKDYYKAVDYFELSSVENNSDALLYLGILYYNGFGVKQDDMKALEFLNLSAKQNNAEALFYLGILYFNGFLGMQNYTQAKKYFELSAKQNNSEALLYLGIIYLNGYGVAQDNLKAVEYFELSAKQNNSKAIFNLKKLYSKGFDNNQNKSMILSANQDDNSYNNLQIGISYENRNGTKHDYINARKYYQLSANENNPEALYNLGYLYFNGLGVKQDYSKAIDYFESSAKLNNSNAFYELGKIYLNGIGVNQNYEKAMEYFELSTKQNNSKAKLKIDIKSFTDEFGIKTEGLEIKGYQQNISDIDSLANLNLGLIYFYGFEGEKNYFKAKEYFQLAANKNNSEALLYLGLIYSNGYGVKCDYTKAREYFELSSQKNNVNACYNLGIIYSKGLNVKQDYTKAKEYFEIAAKNNNQYALLNLGTFYLHGLGVKQDHSKAFEYFQLAAKEKNPDAYYNLGFLYSNGLGVKQDYLIAINYYELSAKQNNSNALLNLGIIYSNGFGVKKDYSKAMNYYKLAADLNNSYALLNIGTLYENGYGVKQNYLKAKEYYQLAANQKNSYALLYLGIIYANGYGIKQDCIKAINYFELAAKLSNCCALYNLGCIYSDKEKYSNLSKAIKYFLKCFEIHYQKIKSFSSNNNYSTIITRYNFFCYRSANDLGLIYLLYFQDLEKGTKYIKESAFAEYPFGQNNLGLLNQFYFNDFQKAKHFYNRSSEHSFCLAEYNLGYLSEKGENPEESIGFFINASKHEDNPLIFQEKRCFDERLQISITFIICLVNLKLVKFYLSEQKYVESKKYFIKVFSKLNIVNENQIYQFQFNMKESKNIFSYLKSFILFCPLFNLENQPNQEIQNYIQKLDLEIHNNKSIENQELCNKKQNMDLKIEISKEQLQENNKLTKTIMNKKKEVNNSDFNQTIDSIFYEQAKIIGDSRLVENLAFSDPGELFDYMIENDKYKEKFIDEIKDIIDSMEKILYIPPYSILFGRINTNKPKSNSKRPVFNKNMKNIDKMFYEGFGLI